MPNDALERWVASLQKRHLADLTFQEVSRALRALSASYVERRGEQGSRQSVQRALSGAGKRAAFALYYGPLHCMFVDRVVAELPGETAPDRRSSAGLLVDLGCGTGAAGAAWAVRAGIRRVVGIDRNAWALSEAARTYREFRLDALTRQGDAAQMSLPHHGASLIAAFTMNELPAAAREDLMCRLVQRATTRGDRVLIVEPIARSIAPWWDRWAEAFVAAGGRADEWRFRVDLPAIVAELDRAAGLDHRELTGRTLWLSRRGGDPASSS